jgi:hypothetical protein
MKELLKGAIVYFLFIFIILGILFVMIYFEKRLIHFENLAVATLAIGELALILWSLAILFLLVLASIMGGQKWKPTTF